MMAKQLRYLGIAQTIKSKIRQGVFPQGQCLPSQKELAEIFDTSVMTIRGALAELAQEGIVNVIHGVGTFVASTGVHSDTIGLQGFQNEMGNQKRSIRNTVLSIQHQITDSRLDKLFGTSKTQFSCLTRLRTIDETPVILQRSYVDSSHQHIFDTYRADQSLYQYFTTQTGILITQGKEIMTPVILRSPELELLQLEGAATAFLSERISISIDDVIVLYDEAYLAGPYVMMASRKLGRTSVFKYIINNSGTIDAIDSFAEDELWEDLG
jgi:DNA-binding GntR family transcriptional regulator